MRNNFDAFIDKFPEITLPITLTEADAMTFSSENPPLSEKQITDYILPMEDEDVDDLTEFIPCFRLARSKDFYCIVYWKAGFLNYQYKLVTLEKGGKVMDKKTLSGTVSDGNVIVQSVAQIDEDWSITIISGFAVSATNKFEPAESTTVELEILPDGRVIELA